jgi:prepilin-type N-terminal cleavage/methylation domain-containing protein
MAMRAIKAQQGLTLIEMTVVIAVIVLLVGLGLPAVRAFFGAFESEGAARGMISAALASARAFAAENQRYAGIRFQTDMHGRQYMVLIIQEPDMLAWGFCVAKGVKPIKMPESIGVMDFTIVTNRNTVNPINSQEIRLDDPALGGDGLINEPFEVTDTTTFSIVFSPSGKLVAHGVQVRNRDGYVDSASNTSISSDDVFNKKAQVDMGIGMFYQDDYFRASWSTYPNLGLGPEPSRKSFVVYKKDRFEQAYEKGRAWSDYLVTLTNEITYVSPHTGALISTD